MHLAIKDICTSGKGENWSEWSHMENLDITRMRELYTEQKNHHMNIKLHKGKSAFLHKAWCVLTD